jgi:hypothetical protein
VVRPHRDREGGDGGGGRDQATYPKIGLREKTGRISVTIPKNGSAMM